MDSPKTKIEILREYAPEMFIQGYSRLVQTPMQPVPVDLKDVSMWENQTFTDRLGRVAHRKVLPILNKEEGKLYMFAAPGNEYPYIGLRYNTMDNKDQFPYIPCCFINPQ